MPGKIEASETLFILVSCNRDPTRLEIFRKVVDNLLDEGRSFGLERSLITFDNASSEPGSEEVLAKLPLVIRSKKNIGYWSAIHWCMENAERVLQRSFKYVYVIESDLIHFRLGRIKLAERYLTLEPAAGAVRLQKFSVHFPCPYSKGAGWWPFRSPDAVWLINAVTKDKVTFRRSQVPSVYHSNFTAKVCALHRFATLKEVISDLGKMGEFGENDFFRLHWLRFQRTGVLNGGLFTAALGYDVAGTRIRSGSYAPGSEYLTTRMAKMFPLEEIDSPLIEWNKGSSNA
jgi:hypothetical protein